MSSLANLEAMLLSDDEEVICVVDPITRIISVPDDYSVAGVISDDDTHIIRIKTPRYVDDDLDLGTFSACVNYMNGGGNVLACPIKSDMMGVYSDHIILNWKLSRLALAYAGSLRFSVCFKKVNAGNKIEKEWNSTFAEITVLEGLEATSIDPDTLKDDAEQLLLNVNNFRAEMLERIANKVDKEDGKGLSTNDYTAADKARVGELTDTYILNLLPSESGTTRTTLTASGTVYAEVGEWSDTNASAENRIGYFVSVDTSAAGTTMVKATSTSTVWGVTMEAPGFAANASVDKYDSTGKLKAKYCYVGIAGYVSVIDNGECDVNDWCMPDGDGTAVPSDTDFGYLVVARVDTTHVLIYMAPQGDIMQRLMASINSVQARIDNLVAAGAEVEGRKELLSGTLGTAGSTLALLDDLSKYDQVEISYRSLGARGSVTFRTSECLSGNIFITAPNIADSASSRYMNLTECTIVFTNSTVTMSRSRFWQWSGTTSTLPTHTDATSDQFTITSIVGIKHTANAELIDLRLGLNGQMYASAGEAVRAHAAALVELQDEITQLSSQIGNVTIDEDAINALIDARLETLTSAEGGEY